MSLKLYEELTSIKMPYDKVRYPFTNLALVSVKSTHKTLDLYYDEYKKMFVTENNRKKGGFGGSKKIYVV